MATKRLGDSDDYRELDLFRAWRPTRCGPEPGSLARSENEKIHVDASMPASCTAARSRRMEGPFRKPWPFGVGADKSRRKPTIRSLAVPYTLRLKSGDFTTVRGQNDNRLRHYRFPRGWDPRCLRRDNDNSNQLRERAAEMRASSSTTGSLQC